MNRLPARVAILSLGLLAGPLLCGHAHGGTVVRFDLNCQIPDPSGPINGFELELYDSTAPLTVTNFLRYVTEGRYLDTFFHRSVRGFVVQGGGYGLSDAGIYAVETYGTVPNEFDPSRSNVRGTVAMAKVGSDPNSATSQWFVNMGDNSANLDNQNGGFTVFARVVGNGMPLIDAINSLPTCSYGPFDQLPLFGDYEAVMIVNASIVGPRVRVWNGTGGSDAWSAAANWFGGAAPSSGDPIAFTGYGSLTSHNDLADRQVNGLEFTATAGAFHLTGEKLLVSGPIANYSTTPQQISLDVELTSAASEFSAVANSTLIVAGKILGNVGVIKNGAGTVCLLDPAYTGNTWVNEGTLELAALSGVGSTTVGNPASAKVAVLKADYIRQDTLTINANGRVEIAAGSGALGSIAPVAVPEPAALLLLLSAAVGILFRMAARV